MYRIAILLGVLLTGCATKPQINYYVLQPDLSVQASVDDVVRHMTIALRNLDLPDYIDNRNIVYLLDNGQIEYAKQQRWVESFGHNLRTGLVDVLRHLTDNSKVLSYPLSANIRPDAVIDIQVSQFIIKKQKMQLVLQAQWQIARPKLHQQGTESHQYSQIYSLASLHPDGIIPAYQHAITDLGKAIMTTLTMIHPKSEKAIKTSR